MMKRKDPYFAAIAVVLIIAVGSAAAIVTGIIGPARNFENVVEVGLSKAELIDVAGEPDGRISVGEEIPRWGNSPLREADLEAWIYYIFPGSQHRFVVFFCDDNVHRVEHDLN